MRVAADLMLITYQTIQHSGLAPRYLVSVLSVHDDTVY
jgi:hypothetical protein